MSNKMDLITKVRSCQYKSAHEEALELIENNAEYSGDNYIAILKGISLALLGKAHEAQQYLITEMTPETSNEYCDYGLAALLTGRLDEATKALTKAIEFENADAVAFGRMAAVYYAMGDLENARYYYQEAVNREPGRAEWHNNLAGILVRQQKLEEALENYDVALSIKPDLKQSIDARQRVLIAMERTFEVVDDLKEKLSKEPESVEYRLRLSRALMQDERPAEAIQILREALIPVEEVEKPEEINKNEDEKTEEQKKWEQQIIYRSLVAEIFINRSMHGMALAALNQILELKPENPIPYIKQKTFCLTEIGRYKEAEKLLDEADEEYSENNQLKMARASLYNESERYDEAEEILRDLLETYPGDAGLKTMLGQTLLWTGKLDEAAELFEEASKINPMALAQMVNAKKFPEDDAALEKMKIIADNPLMAKESRETMSFALAEVYDKKQKYDEAFHYLEQANRLVDKSVKYNPETFTKAIDDIIEVFNKEYFDNLPPIRKTDRIPIFVVGMPRSGTTLTEQILCSHDDIFGAGELPLIAKLSGLIQKVTKSKNRYPFCMDMMTPHLREEAARFYLNGLKFYDEDHTYVVDKMPHNFQHLGLIHSILPKAKIIHIQRDPRDIAVSCFQQNFKMKYGGMGFSFDLVKIARQINDYHRIMQHWREIGIPMFEITYEELVTNQETLSREMLEYVGVGWDEKVKDFYKTERAVRTASVSQVRQPIYQTSKEKWRRYEKYLQPLFDNLNPEVTEKYDKAKQSGTPVK